MELQSAIDVTMAVVPVSIGYLCSNTTKLSHTKPRNEVFV